MALSSASLRAPYVSIPCTNVGIPVGIAEIAIADAQQQQVREVEPASQPETTTMASAVQATTPSHLVSPSSCCCSGDCVRVTLAAARRSCRPRLSIPVAVTTILRCRGHRGVLEHHVDPIAERRFAPATAAASLGSARSRR